jgi:hypothetical protein
MKYLVKMWDRNWLGESIYFSGETQQIPGSVRVDWTNLQGLNGLRSDVIGRKHRAGGTTHNFSFSPPIMFGVVWKSENLDFSTEKIPLQIGFCHQ